MARTLSATILTGVLALATQSAMAQGANIRDQRPLPNGPTYGTILKTGLEQYVFPKGMTYKGVSITRDRVIVRYIRTNGRGGIWFNAYARYSGRLGPFGVVSERATLQYDNGGVNVDLGGMRGVLNTRGLGKWLAQNLRLNNKIDPVKIPRRNEFVTSGGSRFRNRGGGTWIETRSNGPSSTFRQVSGNGEFIELYDSQRRMYVRLYDRYAVWAPQSKQSWSRWPGSDGNWAR